MLLNRAYASTATTGTGSMTLGAALPNYRAWSAAGAVNGTTYSYLIVDGSAWELGRGVYSAGVLTRPGPGVDSAFDSSTGALLSLSGSAAVACVASVADITTDGASKSAANVFTKNQSVAPTVLTDGATISVDAATSNNFRVTLGGNRTLANPTNLTDGTVLNFKIKQDATGSRTLTYGSKYKWPSASAPALSTAANAVDFMSCYYDAADDILICNMTKAFG